MKWPAVPKARTGRRFLTGQRADCPSVNSQISAWETEDVPAACLPLYGRGQKGGLRGIDGMVHKKGIKISFIMMKMKTDARVNLEEIKEAW